jgi:chromosome segregation ATPase
LQELKELANAGVIDPTAVLAESDIRNKEKIAQRMDRVKQLQSQIEGMKDQLSDKEGTIETLERQLVQLGIKDKVRQAEMEIDKNKNQNKTRQNREYLQTEAEQRNLRNILRTELDSKKKDIKNTVKNFQNNVNKNLDSN